MPIGVDQQAELPLLELTERIDTAQLDAVGNQRVRQPVRVLAPDSILAANSTRPFTGMPATRASATVAASCRLPKRSTHVTSVRRQTRPSRRRPSSTTPPIRRTNDAGSIGSPRLLERGARAEPGDGRREQVTPVEGRPSVGWGRLARQLDDVGDRRLGRGLGRGDEQPVVGPHEGQRRAGGQCDLQGDATALRPDSRVDDGEYHAGPQMRHRPHQRVASRPNVEGRDVMRQVDDRRSRGAGGNDRVHHAGELVVGSEVGEEEDGARRLTRHGSMLSAAGCAIARWRPPPPP